MACEYDTFLLCHSSRYLGLERRTVEQASEGGKERGAGARGDASPDAAERREERGSTSASPNGARTLASEEEEGIQPAVDQVGGKAKAAQG